MQKYSLLTLFTNTKQCNFVLEKGVILFWSYEDNCRSSITLAMRHRLCGLCYLRDRRQTSHLWSYIAYTSPTNCYAEYEQRTLYGTLVVTPAMLLHLINCRFIIYYYHLVLLSLITTMAVPDLVFTNLARAGFKAQLQLMIKKWWWTGMTFSLVFFSTCGITVA